MGLFGKKLLSTSMFHIDGFSGAGFKQVVKLEIDEENEKLLLYPPREKQPYSVSFSQITEARMGEIVDKVRGIKGISLEVEYKSNKGEMVLMRFLYNPAISQHYIKFSKKLRELSGGEKEKEL